MVLIWLGGALQQGTPALCCRIAGESDVAVSQCDGGSRAEEVAGDEAKSWILFSLRMLLSNFEGSPKTLHIPSQLLLRLRWYLTEA